MKLMSQMWSRLLARQRFVPRRLTGLTLRRPKHSGRIGTVTGHVMERVMQLRESVKAG